MEKLRAPHPERSRIPRKKAGLLVGVGSGIAALTMITCGGRDGTEPQVQNGTTLTPPDATEPLTPTLTPTLAPTEPLTPTPEVKQEVPCEILPQEFCGQAEVLKYKTLGGDEVIMLGFKDLPPGTEIKAVSDATITPAVPAETSSWKGFLALVELDPEGKKSIVIRGDLSFDSLQQLSVKRGDVITAIKGTGTNNFGYSLLINFVIKENDKYVDNTELLEALFPGVTSKTPVGKIEQTATDVVRSTEYFPEHESPPSGSSTK